MATVLLTSVVRPFGGPGEGASVGAELFHAQVTRAQGAFSLRQVIRVWGLDLIAENLEAPTVVMHYPSMAELRRELETHTYTHVGINFVVATFHKVRQMVTTIRRWSPGTQIILGGYGTVLPDELLLPVGDHICREEGVAFMRRLLGEDPNRPIRPGHSPVTSSRVLGYQQPTVVAHVTAGLGCANGCDFCCTSHFFRRKYVPLRQSGKDIYEAMMETERRATIEGHQVASFALIDEDFFLQRKRAEDFLEAVRSGGRPLSIFGFGSIKGLSQFRASEIAEMGFDLIWTAFEGKKAGYAKLDGRPIGELYEDLKDHGVGVLSSMIIGFPYQDEATVRQEFAELMRLEPALVQILIYFAFPGTPLFENVLREQRFLPQYAENPDLRRWDGFALHFTHPHFSPVQLERLQHELYDEDFRRLGPSIYRLAEIWLRGAERMATSSSELLRKRAARHRKEARALMPTLPAARVLLRSLGARKRLESFRRHLIRDTGPMTLLERALSPAVLGMAAWAELTGRLGILQQPGLMRIEHRLETGETGAGRILALQGSDTSFFQRVIEDAQHLALDRIRGRPAAVQPFRWSPATPRVRSDEPSA